MDTTLLTKNFTKLGARAKIRPLARTPWLPSSGRIVINIARDRRGEFFHIQADNKADVEILDVQPKDRHLLLMFR